MSTRAKLEFHRYDYASYMAFFTYASSSLVVPVALMQIATSLGFPLADGGMGTGGALQLARSISMTILLVLSGFIAGRFGLRKSIGFSLLIMGIGALGAALANSYWMLFFAVLVSGCGEGYIEGTATPFVQKLHVRDTGQYMNFAHSFWSVGVTATTIGAGVLLICGVSWRIIVGAVFVLAIVSASMFLMREKKGHEYPEAPERLSAPDVLRQIRAIALTLRFWLYFLLIFIAGGAEYCLTFWLSSFMQLTLKTSALLGGLATATFAIGMVTGRMGWGILVPDKRLGQSLVAACFTGLCLSSLIPLLTPDLAIGRTATIVILFILLYLIGITIAPLWPTLQTYAVMRLPKHLDETMIFILLSSSGVPGCGIFTTLMGIAGDAWGLRIAFLFVPACQLLIALMLLMDSKSKPQDLK